MVAKEGATHNHREPTLLLRNAPPFNARANPRRRCTTTREPTTIEATVLTLFPEDIPQEPAGLERSIPEPPRPPQTPERPRRSSPFSSVAYLRRKILPSMLKPTASGSRRARACKNPTKSCVGLARYTAVSETCPRFRPLSCCRAFPQVPGFLPFFVAQVPTGSIPAKSTQIHDFPQPCSLGPEACKLSAPRRPEGARGQIYTRVGPKTTPWWEIRNLTKNENSGIPDFPQTCCLWPETCSLLPPSALRAPGVRQTTRFRPKATMLGESDVSDSCPRSFLRKPVHLKTTKFKKPWKRLRKKIRRKIVDMLGTAM